MKTCEQCGKPINRGSTGGVSGGSRHCLVCQVAATLADWRYTPAYAEPQRHKARVWRAVARYARTKR